MRLIPQKNTPRWIIFTIDMLLCLIALGIAYLVRFDFVNISKANLINEWKALKMALPVYLFIRAGLFFVGKSYAGIIRYTSSQDAKRLFTLIFVGTLLFGVLSPLRKNYFDGLYFLPLSIIVVEFLVTTFLLISTRIAVKLLYLETQKSRGATLNVVIYGAGDMGLLTKRTLENDTHSLYNVYGFIDDNSSKRNKLIERVKIGSLNHLKKWHDTDKIDLVVIAINNLNPVNKRSIIDTCLDLDIKIVNVPPLDKWIDGGFKTKQLQNVKIEDLLGRKEIQLDLKKINAHIAGKRILITGAAGSIGSELARQCLNFEPGHLILLDLAESPIYDLSMELNTTHKAANWEMVIADVSNYERMHRVFDHFKPELIFHAAAYKHVPLMEDNPAEAIKVNIVGTKNLVDLSAQFNAETFVMVSTDKAVNPTNVMGASKRIAEIYAQSMNSHAGTNFITTRFGNVLGSNGSVIPLFKKQIERGGPVTVTDPNVTRFFMTIPEACQLVLEAGAMGHGGEIFVFDMGESVKIIDLAKKMIKLSGLTLGEDIHIKITGLRPGEKLYEELLNQEENTIPTHNPKILIGQVREYELAEIAAQILDLASKYTQQNNEAIVLKMKEIVPEFISNNSVFSKFDA